MKSYQEKEEAADLHFKSFPTEEEWDDAVHAGFSSNGATLCPDSIYLTRIANGDNRYPPLPADLHDYRYQTGGEEIDRKFADHEFFDFMLDVIESQTWKFVRPFARRRALKYYEAVRFIGHRFFRYKETTHAQEPSGDDSGNDPGPGTGCTNQ